MRVARCLPSGPAARQPWAMILANHIVLAVHDLDTSAAFFGALGFAEVSRPDGWVFVQRDNCMVMLGLCADALPASELGDHSYAGYLLVDDVDDYYDQIVAAGVTPHARPADKPWGLREFVVRSPEGHRFAIGQRLTDPH